MAVLDIYIDIDRKDRVKGFTDSSIISMPNFAQGDVVTFRVRALQPTGITVGNPYTCVAVAGNSLEVAFGTKVGSSSTHYVEQYSWSTNALDSNDQYFYADVSFNTVELTSFLGSQERASTFLEIKIVGGVTNTIFSKSVTIEAAVIKNATTSTNPGLPYATMAAVLALLQDITTKSVTIQSPDGTHARRLSEDNDGTPHDDQI
jgi:hypothetical protein